MWTDGNYLYGSTDAGAEANKLYADLSSATSATINQLRLAFATQKFLEIQARGGYPAVHTSDELVFISNRRVTWI